MTETLPPVDRSDIETITRIHVTAAEAFEEAASEHSPVAPTIATLALVEATLALVEQQRIANLIAYAAHRNEHTDATGPRDAAPALRMMLGAADIDIRLGLGL